LLICASPPSAWLPYAGQRPRLGEGGRDPLCIRNLVWLAFEPISASPDISLANPGAPSLVLFLSATIFSLFKMVPWWQRVVKLRCVCGSGNECYFSGCAVCCP
jgi:hypothetical protein